MIRSRLLTRLCAIGAAMLVSSAPPAMAQEALFASGFEPFGPTTRAEAARFLNQATFGATLAEADRLMQIGYDAWFAEQFAAPQAWSHVGKTLATAEYGGCSGFQRPRPEDLVRSTWGAYVSAPDQLRHRLAFALSQIMVVSNADTFGFEHGLVSASYLDTLTGNAFGNFRDLIEAVTLHPAMGVYLSHLFNRKEDPASGRIPDQNFARELMQLFTIGLQELNADGTPRLATSGPGAGQPIPTYGQDDIVGLSRVMTGWAWSTQPLNWSQNPVLPVYCDRPAMTSPMRASAANHSTSEKRFLGVVIPAATTPDPVGNLDIALDRLAGHANVGPFIGRQLIQRFVTSNPSPAYVARVSAVFADNGAGVRGDLKAVVKAILMDPEARDRSRITRTDWGKLREPVLRQAQVMRAVGASTIDTSGGFRVWRLGQSIDYGIGMQVLRAPSVFNFYRPTYAPPGTALEAQGLAAPEMQIVDEARIVLLIRDWFDAVSLDGGFTDCCSTAARNFYYWRLDYPSLYPLLRQSPGTLVDRLDLLLMAGTMSPAMRQIVVDAVNAQFSGNSEVSGVARGVEHMKVGRALQLVLASAEYAVQK